MTLQRNIKLAIINHHGRIPGGSENTLLQYLARLPENIEPIFFLFEDGEFAQNACSLYPKSVIIPMSKTMASATRNVFSATAVVDALRLTQSLVEALREAQVDAVMTNTVKAHFVGSVAAKILGLPLINYIHDILEGPGKYAIRWLSGFAADQRIVCSEHVSASLQLKNTAVVYSPIKYIEDVAEPSNSEARLALGLPDDGRPVVGLVGRIAPWKGHDRFIRIANKVLKSCDAHFAIIGGPVFGCDPKYIDQLHQMVTSYAIESRVHFVPWQNSMANAYSAINIGCNCSTREPFGRTTVEAQMYGVPVICFDDAGVCETYEHGKSGFKIPTFNEDAYADAISTYLLNGPLRLAAGKLARVSAKKMDIEELAPKFVYAVLRGVKPTR